jgi:hypothetical protein
MGFSRGDFAVRLRDSRIMRIAGMEDACKRRRPGKPLDAPAGLD